ncbi:hypothetical protein [Litchfieldia alkalitelluris]|nr:hypothetical protein [Litchfieldia alkalitelluris]
MGFNDWSPKHKRAEIRYEIHSEHWRKGYVNLKFTIWYRHKKKLKQ